MKTWPAPLFQGLTDYPHVDSVFVPRTKLSTFGWARDLASAAVPERVEPLILHRHLVEKLLRAKTDVITQHAGGHVEVTRRLRGSHAEVTRRKRTSTTAILFLQTKRYESPILQTKRDEFLVQQDSRGSRRETSRGTRTTTPLVESSEAFQNNPDPCGKLERRADLVRACLALSQLEDRARLGREHAIRLP